MMAVIAPRRVKDIKDISKAIGDGEVKVNTLTYEVDLEDRTKVALPTSTLLNGHQDFVF